MEKLLDDARDKGVQRGRWGRILGFWPQKSSDSRETADRITVAVESQLLLQWRQSPAAAADIGGSSSTIGGEGRATIPVSFHHFPSFSV